MYYCQAYDHRLKPGVKVRVVRPLSDSEQKLYNKDFIFQKWTGLGYAACEDREHRSWGIHPEALTIINEEVSK